MAKKTFHRITRTQDNKMEWVKTQGEQIVIEGYTFYLCKVEFNYTSRPQQTLIEDRSGASVGNGDTKQIAIDHFKDRLNSYGRDTLEELIEESVKKYGQSPSYSGVVYNPVMSEIQ